MYEFNQVLLLLQQMCVYLVIAYLLSKTPLFIPLMQVTIRLPHKLLCYVIFGVLHHGHLFRAAHSGFDRQHPRDRRGPGRAAGRAVGGLSGRADRRPAPVYARRHDRRGLRDLHGVGRPGRRHRTQHRHAPGRIELLFNPLFVGGVALVAEVLQMAIIRQWRAPTTKRCSWWSTSRCR